MVYQRQMRQTIFECKLEWLVTDAEVGKCHVILGHMVNNHVSSESGIDKRRDIKGTDFHLNEDAFQLSEPHTYNVPSPLGTTF